MRIINTLLFFLLIGTASVAFSETRLKTKQSIDFNFGLSASKSILGFSFTTGKNQFNTGLRGLAYSGRDGYLVQPGFAYNRYITENGIYTSLIYVATYQSQNVQELVYNSETGSFSYQLAEQKGWDPGVLMAGLGKSWQYTHWGLHADAGIVTNAYSDFGTAWGFYLGGGLSYRFHLGD
jgi:hypothetical protein